MQHHVLLINIVHGLNITQGCVNVTLLTLKGLCVWSKSVSSLFNNISFQMCPQIKVKNYDKVEKVSVCYHMKLNVEFIDGVILL